MSKLRTGKISELTPDTQNPNAGTERGNYMLTESVQRCGLGRSIVADKHGNILAGNKTHAIAGQVGLDETIIVKTTGNQLVVVQRDDLDLTADSSSEEYQRARELTIADNQSGAVGLEWDAESFETYQEEGVDLDTWFMPDELEQVFEGGEDPVVEEEDEEAIADDLDKAGNGGIESRVSEGQIWACGRHRIACGDSTDEGAIRALLGGKLIDMIFTDPPYGVSYADKNKSLNAVAPANRIQTPIENDHLSADECFQSLWKPCFSALINNAHPGCSYYVCSPQGGELMMMMMMALHETGWLLKPQIIWVKNNHVLGRSDYQLKHEPILYGWKPGGSHYFTESRSEMSVWEFDKPLKSDLHPTMKPVELVEYAIGNSSKSGAIIFDAFLGSGTTLIAAQQMKGNRTVYGMELSPHYCEVILRRHEKLTGETAELVGSL